MKLNPNKHYRSIRNAFIVVSLGPTLWLAVNYLVNGLMPNPFSLISNTFGHSALILTLSSLAMSPLRFWSAMFFTRLQFLWGRRVADWNFLIKIRRPVGLAAFIYGCLHVIAYLYFELDFTWGELVYEVSTRRFIAVGMLAFSMLTILAITSPTLIKRKMGKSWLILHKLNYLLCILVVLHYWMFIKVINMTAILYLVSVTLLILHRIAISLLKPDFRGDETKRER